MDSTLLASERKAGNKAATTLRSSFRSVIKSRFHRRSGEMEKSTVTTKFRDGRLDRLILKSPHYSFKEHFGSTLTGTTGETHRKATNVREFIRNVKGKQQHIKANKRRATDVKAHNKGINYKARNHIAIALKKTNALDQLATEIGQNRIVEITSQIDFK